ncbi:MAG TPA: copper chaperone PCu(A)C [Acidisphaera sp.]|nr:copper chaperone PCu(A)C [Acidisphaera sp.]
MRYLFKALLLALLFPAAAYADGVTVDHAWSRPALAGRVGVAYFTITDTGAPDRLTGVASPVARQVELHETITDNGIKKMRPVDAVAVGPDKPVLFAPGGYHVMLVGLNQALKAGETFPLTLTFEHAGTVAVTVQVEGSRAAAGGMGNMPGMAH